MKLENLLKKFAFNCIQGSLGTEINGVTSDSREVVVNGLFVCIKGAVSDGHNYALKAVEKGACTIVLEDDVENIPENITVIKVNDSRYALACIAAEFFGNPAEKLKVIGIQKEKLPLLTLSNPFSKMQVISAVL